MTRSTKRIKPTKKIEVPVSLSGELVEEQLPLPWVHYPNHYGAFFAFSEERESEQFFCLCSKQAVQNCVELSNESNISYSTPDARARLSSKAFPNSISIKSVNDSNYMPSFKPNLCHRCNISTPTRRYCDAMYGGNFKQFFGWYLQQNTYKLGFSNYVYIDTYCPDVIIDLIDCIKNSSEKSYELSQKNIPFCRDAFQEISVLQKATSKQKRKLDKMIEDITREEFGFRKVGERNISESILANIIQMIFVEQRIVRNIRPEILEGLEIDIFLPDINLGFEYQGQQHFHPIKAWGGNKALQGIQDRDKRKRELCKLNNIILIDIDYTEPLEFNYIKMKIDKLNLSL
jgi:hypothetical protein